MLWSRATDTDGVSPAARGATLMYPGAVKWSYGPLGVKDFFTLINLMGGVAGIAFLVAGRPADAGLSLLLGYVFGDTLDGVVARLTRTSNRFGGAFDSVTDHLTQAIVPGMVVYVAYRQAGHPVAGFVGMSALIAFGTIRHALFSVASLDTPLMYCGLPRTVSGFAAMSFALSHVFLGTRPAGFAVGAVLIPALAAAGVLPIPYMTHRGARRVQGYVKVVGAAFFVTPAIALAMAPHLMFDVLFLWMMIYAVAAWFPLTSDERTLFYDRYRRWFADVRR